MSTQITLIDNEMEVLIRHYRDLIGDDSRIIDNKRNDFKRMKYFVNNRSDKQIMKMEKEKGLND